MVNVGRFAHAQVGCTDVETETEPEVCLAHQVCVCPPPRPRERARSGDATFWNQPALHWNPVPALASSELDALRCAPQEMVYSFELQFSPLQNEKNHSLTPGHLGALSQITYEKSLIPSKALCKCCFTF